MDEELDKIVGGTDIEKLCLYYRGVIIQCVVFTEELIDLFLMEYYLRPSNPNLTNIEAVHLFNEYKHKRNEFLHSVLEKEQFNLTFKTNALFFLFYKHCKSYLDEHPTFKKDIIELIDQRNAFAHRKLNETISDIGKKEVILVYHTSERQKPKVEETVMNTEKLKIFIDKYRQVNNWLIECGSILNSKQHKENKEG
ncbi:MAG TPA: hypothetical protein VK808_02675 [Bacteroidia bacterium]|jgi:hypothetical protein|nr:hypothetical protein [Bacteroidia bacterium]